MHAYADDINAKLICKGTNWVGEKKYEIKNGYIDIANNKVTTSGFVGASGTFRVITEKVRDDFLPFENVANPLINGSINRITGETAIMESNKKDPAKGGQALFVGSCTKAKQMF